LAAAGDDAPIATDVVRRELSPSVLSRVLREQRETFFARSVDPHGGRSLPAHVEHELRGATPPYVRDRPIQSAIDHLDQCAALQRKAIAYMLKHWEGLTLFLRQPGAPLDNNTCERALKKAVHNRKNAYFYRTQYGAEVGDLYMSLIHTCERAKTSAFEYMRTLPANPTAVAKAPADWIPWNYAASAAQLKAAATPKPA